MDAFYLWITFCVLIERTVNGQKLVSINKTINASNEFDPWYVRHAVDGDPNIDKDDNCKCCAANSPNTISWFRLDLGQSYTVHSLVVLGRAQHGTLINMDIALGTSSSNGVEFIKNPDAVRTFNYTLPNAKAGQYVTFTQRDQTTYFVICELYVYAVCDGSTYGPECVNRCGQCLNQTCDTVNGSCKVCATGYTLPLCSECSITYHGSDCKQRCFCADGDCSKASGLCPTAICSAGYSGEKCDTPCDNNHYGQNCNETCGNCLGSEGCNKENGTCQNGCGAGYKGNKCIDACNDEYYGKNCNETCGECFGADVCYKSNGTCPNGCEAGYEGHTCKDACDHDHYGRNCHETCGKCVDECFKHNGTCLNGCAAGYEGSTCKIATFEPNNVPIGLLVGAIAGGVIVVTIVIIVVVIILKRRRQSSGSQNSNKSFKDIRGNDIPEKSPMHQEPNVSVQVKTEKKASAKKQAHASVEAQPSVPNVPDTETENVYYAFLTKKSDLKICQLWDYINFKQREDCVMFYQEYSLLSNKLKHPYDVAMKPQNREKTRYKGLFAYDHSRVPLDVEDDTEVEYINASFIDGYDKPHKFIASQGPTDNMRDDFWRMIWQQKSKSIVMLTNLIEGGSVKCISYWPPSIEKTVTYGNITITLLSETSTLDFDIRQMKISKKGEENTLPVTQFHYKAWPDKSIPDSTWSLVKFWLKVEGDASKAMETGPIVVHCSAGIGRTGTYIALDNAYYQAKLEGTVRILDVVKSLREQRVGMVQTNDQYVYLHEAVADALLLGTHFVWSNQFEDVYEYLSQKEKGSSITRLQTQFNVLVDSIADKKSVHTTVEDSDNEYSNIFIQQKPADVTIDEYRPKSKSLVYVQEVGALILQNHEAKDAFIVCKSPTESRMTEFWSLVKEQNVKTIVSLADVSMTSSKRSAFLGLKNKVVQDKFGLSITEERNTSIFTERKINIKDSTDDIIISQFEYNDWVSGDNVPKDPSSMANFVEAVLDRQRRLSEIEPVLIFCTNGTQRCGVMCALLSEVFRMIRDGGHINILETVKMMKERHDGIIANLEQYVFIHDVIRTRVQDNTYQNQ